jgi:hypothetical protein
MKKLTILMAVAAVVCFSVPAMAVDWNFYGSARMETYWTSDDQGDNGEESDGLIWDWLNGSRIGANVKADHLRGRFELGLKADGTADVDVGTRRLEGAWKTGGGEFMVAKSYTPINQFVSGQVARGDAGLLGIGFLYAGRPGFLQYAFGGFKVALVEPERGQLAAGSNVEANLPKLEASWGMAMDAFNFNIVGGAQSYEEEQVGGSSNTDDFDVMSWVLGADAGFNFGPAYIKAGISYAQNGGDAGLTAGGATFTAGDDDIEDTTTLQGGLVAGMKLSDMVSFEVGAGYRMDDNDDYDDDIQKWEIYGQSVIALAPGVYVIPEIGYADHGDDEGGDDAGDDWYIGGKWQIDF